MVLLQYSRHLLCFQRKFIHQLEKKKKKRTAIQPKKIMTCSYKNGHAGKKKKKKSKMTITTSATLHQIIPCCGGCLVH